MRQEKKYLLCYMIKKDSLVSGIGNQAKTKLYYDTWSNDYDATLESWDYKIPFKSSQLLKKNLKIDPERILDLACGTGLFGSEVRKIYKKSIVYGLDISNSSLKIARQKNVYYKLQCLSFEKKIKYNFKFDLISLMGSMTYVKNFEKLFNNVLFNLKKTGFFIFSHRVDLWKKNNFDKVLLNYSQNFKVIHKSRPILYLPLNNDFGNKIKVKIVLLQKY